MSLKKDNKIAIVGFVLAFIGLCVLVVPFFNWIIWLLGLIFSLVGLKQKRRKGFAIAGTVLSVITFLLMTLFPAVLVFIISKVGFIY